MNEDTHPLLLKPLTRAAEVTEIDLSYVGLTEFPEELLSFPHLRALSLEGNPDLERLDPRIERLASLEVLVLNRTGLTGLPESIGRLPALRLLDLSHTPLRALPESLCDLDRLEGLHAAGLACPLPAGLARLRSLRDLRLPGLRPDGGEPGSPVDFPEAVTRLPRLRSLDLSGVRLASVPDTLLDLTGLEELHLSGSLSDRLDRLPDLARLPRLRVLRLGGGAAPGALPPGRGLLSGIWGIATLEHLEIDHWGEEVRDGATVRTAFRSLPEDAFARMPGLRHLDLSFNELAALPEPFFALRRLESANLRSTRLDGPTVDRVRAAFPEAYLVLEDVGPREDADGPGHRRVRELVRSGTAKLDAPGGPDLHGAAADFREAAALCVPGAHHSDHDRLFVHHALVQTLVRLVETSPGADRPALTAELIAHGERALSLLPDRIDRSTGEGALQETVERWTGNTLAWYLLRSGEPERALAAVERALPDTDDPECDFIRDTQVRVLLALGRDEDAYRVVDRVLARVPGYLRVAGIVIREPVFGDLTDIIASPAYRKRSR